MVSRILLLLLGLLLLSQLAQPDRSVAPVDPAKDMLVMTNAPADIQQMVIGACYDCHSDKTAYPWYAYITPVNFWLQDHINEGREVVNFSHWDLFAGNEEAGESGETIAEGEMPPKNYIWMHGHARLSEAQRRQLIDWFNTIIPGTEGGNEESGGEEEGDRDRWVGDMDHP